jgi:DNA-binding response OmpR family regulator
MTEEKGNLFRCPGCEKLYRVNPEKLPPGLTSFNCRTCGSLIPLETAPDHVPEDARRIIIAISEDDLSQLVLRILARGQIQGVIAATGEEVLATLAKDPAIGAILLNVSLMDTMGYELLDRIRKMPGGDKMPVILLSAIHHAMRYKRAPSSLYGANDYIERHHLPDMLIPKLTRMMEPGSEVPGADDPSVHEPHTDEQVAERREIEEICRDDQVVEDPAEEKVRRMCRVIAGDIALYNEDTIGTSTSMSEVFEAISGDLEEGILLLAEKFPDSQDKAAGILRDEMQELLAGRGIVASG